MYYFAPQRARGLYCPYMSFFFVREDANDRMRKKAMAAAKKKGGFLLEFEG